MTAQDFPAFCPRGHRIIPSTGECWSMREADRWGCDEYVFEYVTGDCATVSAAFEEAA